MTRTSWSDAPPRLYFLVSVALALWCSGCDPKHASKEQGQSEMKASAAQAVEEAPVQAPQDAAPIADDKEIRTALDRWVQAQNEGNFAGYRALYATRFTGVKRAGDRVFRMGRDEWLKDR